VRPRRLAGVGARPLNFTVRWRDQIRLCNESDKCEEPRQRPFVWHCGSARGPCARSWVIFSASAAFVADAAVVKAEVALSLRAGFALRKPRAHSRLDEGVL